MLSIYTNGLIMSEPLSRETVRMVIINNTFTFKRVRSLVFAETNNYCFAKTLSVWL